MTDVISAIPAHDMLVYKYAIRGDLPDCVVEEMFRGHQLSNQFVELELAHQQHIADIWATRPEVEATNQKVQHLEEVLEEALVRAAETRKTLRSTKIPTELRDEIRAIKAELKTARQLRRDAKSAAYEATKPLFVEARGNLKAAQKDLYRTSVDAGLYWANYNEIKNRHDTAVKAVTRRRVEGGASQLRFRRWSGEGTLAVQLQRGANDPQRTPMLLADPAQKWRNVAQFSHSIDPTLWDTMSRGDRRGAARGTFRFRIGSGDLPEEETIPVTATITRDPQERGSEWTLTVNDTKITTASGVTALKQLGSREHGITHWTKTRPGLHEGRANQPTLNTGARLVEVPIVMHRPIHPDADITMIRITRRRIAGSFESHISVIARVPHTPNRTEGTRTAVHLGWRALPNGDLRVAAISTHTRPPQTLLDQGFVRPLGADWEVRIPANQRGKWEHHHELQAVRDTNLNSLKNNVTAWFQTHPNINPTDLNMDTVHQWRSPNRFAAAALRLRNNPPENCTPLTEMLEAWRKQDRHLWEWQRNEQNKTLARRHDVYGQIAAWLATTPTAVINVDEWSISSTRQTPNVENEDTEQARHARANAVIAAPGELRAQIISTAARNGVTIQNPEIAAGTHHSCGGPLNKTERQNSIWTHCEKCNNEVDQDANTLAWMLHPAA